MDAASPSPGTPGPPRWSVQGVGVIDLLIGLTLSVLVFVAVHAEGGTDPHGDLLAGFAATSLTLPVIWARRSPLTAAGVVAVGSVVNWLAVGSLVRCGPSLPAAFWIAFVVGRRTSGRRGQVALCLVLIDIVGQCLSDPQLGAAVILGMGPIAAGFALAGRAITGRAQTIRAIEAQNAAILKTRDRTAALAVATDRERISAGLDGLLQQQIQHMATQARRAGEDRTAADTAGVFAGIAAEGRQALAEMRDIVGNLRDEPGLDPQPGLDRLPRLVGDCGGRLELAGGQRQLPGSIEVSAYRIVEQLLQVLDPGSCVRVEFAPDRLGLMVTGRPGAQSADATALAVVRQRIAVHAGTLTVEAGNDQLCATAQLPLPVGHA